MGHNTSWDPRTKMVALLPALLSCTLSSPTGSPEVYGTLLLGVVAWVILHGGPIRPLIKRTLLLWTPFLGLFLVVPFASSGQMAATGWRVVDITIRGWMISTLILFCVHGLSAFHLLACLSRWRFPPWLIVFLAIQARQIRTLRDEALRILRTLALRGNAETNSRIRSRARMAKVLAVRLIPSAMLRADRVADALILRSWEGDLPDPGPWRFRKAEWPAWVAGGIHGTALILGVFT